VAASFPAVGETGSVGNERAAKAGVAPLRAGQGASFWLRRLHSLSGIVPVGAFLIEHILISNSAALNGPTAYAHQVRFLASLPLVPILELFGVWLPILFHAGYGFYIWYRGETNLLSYPWSGNWMYTAQRWTGGIAFAYVAFHTYTLRFSLGLVSASWHFAYGLWLFCAKWGLVSGEKAQKRLLVACLGFFVVMSGVGLGSLYTMRVRYDQQPVDAVGATQIEDARPSVDE